MAVDVLFTGLFVFGFLAMALALVSFRHLWWLRFFQVAAFSLLCFGFLIVIVSSAAQGRAVDFTRHLEWFEDADHPIKFWISVVLHVVLSVALLWWTWASLRRLPLRAIAESDLTPGFISVVRWIILAMAVGAVALWARAVLPGG